jgi:hypothetical protein
VAQSRTAIHEEETREESKPAGTLQNKLAEFIGRLGIVPELLPVKIMFFLLNFASAAFICYVNIYYMGLGLSVSQIGILAGIRPFVTLISAPLWSSLADKFQIHRWVCLGAIGIVIALRILLIFVKQFGLLVAITIGDEMFSATIAPLVDSNAIAVLGPQRADLYGRQRLFAGMEFHFYECFKYRNHLTCSTPSQAWDTACRLHCLELFPATHPCRSVTISSSTSPLEPQLLLSSFFAA